MQVSRTSMTWWGVGYSCGETNGLGTKVTFRFVPRNSDLFALIWLKGKLLCLGVGLEKKTNEKMIKLGQTV